MSLPETEPAPPPAEVRFPVRTAAEIGSIAILAGLIYARTFVGLFDG
jgi:hypothetical protein